MASRRVLSRLIALVTCLLAHAQPRSPRQVAWQQLETTVLLHFTVNTFTDKEWSDGTEKPAIFNPTQLDAGQKQPL